jgi:hypothetical protein
MCMQQKNQRELMIQEDNELHKSHSSFAFFFILMRIFLVSMIGMNMTLFVIVSFWP